MKGKSAGTSPGFTIRYHKFFSTCFTNMLSRIPKRHWVSSIFPQADPLIPGDPRQAEAYEHPYARSCQAAEMVGTPDKTFIKTNLTGFNQQE
jgi:hypothetical protein